jgi:GTP-binding protein Era
LRSGFVAIIGRPSAGKSTLLNNLIGEKVSIVSKIPQTTRNQIRGIYQGENYQIIFLDTPGFHFSAKKFNRKLVLEIGKSARDADVILYLIDISRKWGEEETKIVDFLRKHQGKPLIIALNKIDLVQNNNGQLFLEVEKHLKSLNYQKMISFSALEKINLKQVLTILKDQLPEGPRYYPDDYYTDQSFVSRVTEIVREKVFQLTQDEIPHGCYCDLDYFEEKQAGKLLVLKIIIYIEQESQKKIMIGKNGSLIKKIGVLAREDLEQIFDRQIYLDLKVKVRKNWRKDEKILQKMF